ncbi:MAG: hypothetical protein ACJAV5_000886 [Vicingaceae bacterium]|jgi:hypothetical protein
MIKFLILGLIVIVAIFTIVSCSNKQEKKTVVLGQELADAEQKEQERLESEGYSDSPFPEFNYSKWKGEKSLINPQVNELDSFIVQLTRQYTKANKSKRNDIRNSINQDDIYTIFTFCQRAAIFGIRENGNKSFIENSLNSLAMVDPERCDYRDALVAMAFANHGILKSSLNRSDLYNKAAKLANPKMAELLIGFEARKIEDQSIENMAGYTEIQTESGIGFVQFGYEKFQPKVNLSEIGFKISEFIENEKYQGASISVGESLPLIWVDGEDNSELKEILNRSLGTVSLRAYPKEDLCEDWISQMFLLFIIECKNQTDANRVFEIANDSKSKNHSKIILRDGELFCILITRSTTVGVDDFENAESIQRFKEPLLKLIKENKSN